MVVGERLCGWSLSDVAASHATVFKANMWPVTTRLVPAQAAAVAGTIMESLHHCMHGVHLHWLPAHVQCTWLQCVIYHLFPLEE